MWSTRPRSLLIPYIWWFSPNHQIHNPEHSRLVEGFLEATHQDDHQETDELPAIIEAEVTGTLARLRPKKVPRSGTPSLRRLPEWVMKWITSLFNSCLGLKHFPAHWKQAKLILLSKPHKNLTLPDSYHPSPSYLICPKSLSDSFWPNSRRSSTWRSATNNMTSLTTTTRDSSPPQFPLMSATPLTASGIKNYCKLAAIRQCLRIWKVKVNTQMSEAICFTKHHNYPAHRERIHLQGNLLRWTKSIKYLGVVLNKTHDWACRQREDSPRNSHPSRAVGPAETSLRNAY
ncbi:hypothetical protein J6590_069425 [Homalodisca vitripennis]|nr:hypothetical protein J6590_069425 [Homalodisca vitripennis]